METKRTQMVEQLDESGVTSGDIRDARIASVRLIKVICDILDLPGTVDEETKMTILQPLKTAEDKARNKARGRDESEEASPDGPEKHPAEIDAALSLSDDAEQASEESATGS